MTARAIEGMILAAGLGQRLRPLTLLRAKPAIPFLNRPLIHGALDLLASAGVESVVVNTHHLPESIHEAVQSFQTSGTRPFSRLAFSHEERILGTAGAIGNARRWLSGNTLIVCSGKLHFEGALDEAVRFHEEEGSLATLLLVPLAPEDTYNPVLLDERSRVAGFGRELPSTAGLRPFGFAGIHILSSSILDFIPTGASETVKDLYPRLIQQELPVRGFVTRDYWCECSTPSHYLERSMEVLARTGRSNLTEENFPLCRQVIAGTSARIHEGARLDRSVLWDGVQVGERCQLRNTIVTTGVRIPAGSNIADAVVTAPTLAGGETTPSGTSFYGLWPL